MKYVWIWILLGIYVIWLISSIVDVVRAVRQVKNNRWYDGIGDFIDCMLEELEEYTVVFVAAHLFLLFMVSLATWIKFKTGGAE